MTLDEEIAIANAAQAILDNDLFKTVMDEERHKWIIAWINTGINDKEAREACWRHYKAAEALTARFKSITDTGKMARMQKEKNAQVEGGLLDE